MPRVPRRDEEFARSAFDSFLRSAFPYDPLVWNVPSPDPPDFHLIWANASFAVEVTSASELVSHNGRMVEQITLRKSLFRFIRYVQAQAQGRHILSGTYGVKVSPVANLRAHAPNITSAILKYLQATQATPTSPPHIVHGQGHTRWWIQKTSSTGHSLTPLAAGAKWKGEALTDIRSILQRVIAQKAHSLRHVPSPWILLLLDRYLFADAAAWFAAAPSLPADFSVIARVGGFRDCRVLHSTLAHLPAAG